jgi:spore germination protein KB
MKLQETISANQMSVLFFCFMTGSSFINIPGPLIGYSKNGAWVSLLISLSIGVTILSCVLYLYNKYPSMSLIEYSRDIVGKWMTIVLAIPFISILFHIVAGIILDIGVFMTNSMMRETPFYVFNLLIFSLAATTVRLGIEVMARMFVLLILAVTSFVFFILFLASFKYHIEYLLPVMPYGIKPILLGAYFSYGFPYVELVLFAMILPFAHKEQIKKLNKGMFLALIFNGFCLICVTISSIMLFGPIAGLQKYSMYELARTIEILEVFQRIESLIGISLIVGSYMKATIALFALNLTFSHLFKLKNNRLLIYPVALVCFLISVLIMTDGEARWVNIVSVIDPLWGTLAFIIPLFVLTIVSLFKKQNSTASH